MNSKALNSMGKKRSFITIQEVSLVLVDMVFIQRSLPFTTCSLCQGTPPLRDQECRGDIIIRQFQTEQKHREQSCVALHTRTHAHTRLLRVFQSPIVVFGENNMLCLMQTELMTTVSPNNRGLISVWPPHVAEDTSCARTAHLCLRASTLPPSV